MLATLAELSQDSKVWIYQTDRQLSEGETKEANLALESFAAGWLAHGAAVRSFACTAENHFLLFFADERFSGVSGCSIDSSVRLVRDLGSRFSVDFFQRLNVAVKTPDGIRLIHRDDLAEEHRRGLLNPETPVYDHTVQTLRDWQHAWIKPISETWAAQWMVSPVQTQGAD